ncbi:MAG TPA: adenylate/guanylate cyclase domain-containing protein [Actinomycetota bacterium]|nr:adenylate/guanylate cyclase domain-containing protein [Actinomycetota bacterium]
MPGDRLTEEELADRAGVSRRRIGELVDLGILRPEGGTFARSDVMRARVVIHLDSMGIAADDLATALASGHLSLGYLESAGRRHPRADRTFADVADGMGVPFATLERIFVAFGLPVPTEEELVREEDLQVLAVLPVLFGAGVDEGEVLRLARVWGDSARRVAQYLPHYFHATVEQRFRQGGLGDNQAYEAALREVGVRTGRSGEDLLGWLFRRHLEVFLMEHQFEHVEVALEDAGVRRRPPREVEAAVFADLSGYTRLTEEAGDEVAAAISLTLAQLVSEVAARHRGTVVKMLGDGVHFHFRDPHDAVRGSLEIVERAPGRGLPPAHVGVNAGPMIYDEGDYFGRTVNVAARIASEAKADQVFVGEDAERVLSPSGFHLVEVGPRELKGVSKPVTVYEALRDGA